LLTVLPVTRGDWALHSLESYRPILERLAVALGQQEEGEPDQPDASAQFMGDLGKLLGPVLLGLQSGVMLGHLARHSFGQYDLPLPRRAADQLLLIPANVDEFATEWNVEPDDLRMLVCLSEITHHAVLGRPHVRDRLLALLDDYVSRFHVDPDAVESSFGELDLSDPGALHSMLGNPETLLGAVQTPEQHQVRARIEVLLTAVVGYVDHVVDTVGQPLISSYGRIMEAIRRRRSGANDGERFAGRLLGLEVGRAHYERGTAFVNGVVERAGEEGLRRLWHSERELPTAAELDAPGLWLARIDLPAD
ncbi:MAG: zinc-dependent metalloprotease, partial [Actinobacteria bacterium]|nr:zinc-dependent metalloprotease [Actinomycetota bacterium]